MLLRVAVGAGRALRQEVVRTGAGRPFTHSHTLQTTPTTIWARSYSRKGEGNKKHPDDDPRMLAAEELFPEEIEHPDRDFQHNIMPELPHDPDDNFDDNRYEVNQIRQQNSEVKNEPLTDDWVYDRSKGSYFNPLTKEVKVPFWKSQNDFQVRRANRYAKLTEAQEKRPLPFFADQKWDKNTQFYWEHEMAKIRNRYNYLDFKELDRVLGEADTRFFSNEEDMNIIPFGPVLEDNQFQRGTAEAKAEADKAYSHLVPVKYHVKDFVRTHGSKVGKKLGFGTMVIGGNRKGVAGYGYGKGKDLGEATRMAAKDLRKNLVDIPLDENRTIFCDTIGTYGTTIVILGRCKRGHGISAGTLLWALCDCLGISDITTKVYGSTHPLHVTYAFFRALVKTKSGRESALLRGQNYVKMYERGVKTLNPPSFEKVQHTNSNILRYITQAEEQYQARQAFTDHLLNEADSIRDQYAMEEENDDGFYPEGVGLAGAITQKK